MEADFARYYHLDLRALCYGDKPWGVRRLLAHINGIPADSTLRRHRLGEEKANWTTSVELQAATVDLLQLLLRVQAQDPPPFKAVPRPWSSEETADPNPRGLADLKDFLEGM